MVWGGRDGNYPRGLVIRGTIHWLTWGGSPIFEAAPDAPTQVSDPLPDDLIVYNGETIHSVMETSTSDQWANHTELEWWTPSRREDPGHYTGDIGAMNQAHLRNVPQGIYGMTVPSWELSVAQLGDSFSREDWGTRALQIIGAAWSNLAQGAEKVPTGLPEGRLPTTTGVPYPTLLAFYGGNSSTLSYDAQVALHIGHWDALATTGARIATCTLHPYSLSTDSWATVEGQTADTYREPARSQRNDWLRDGAPLDSATRQGLPEGTTDPAAVRIGEPGHPIHYPLFDIADHTETTRNSGIWRVEGGAWTSDGTHLTQHGADMLHVPFLAWLRDHVA